MSERRRGYVGADVSVNSLSKRRERESAADICALILDRMIIEIGAKDSRMFYLMDMRKNI